MMTVACYVTRKVVSVTKVTHGFFYEPFDRIKFVGD
jgi:hypothetical protein